MKGAEIVRHSSRVFASRCIANPVTWRLSVDNPLAMMVTGLRMMGNIPEEDWEATAAQVFENDPEGGRDMANVFTTIAAAFHKVSLEYEDENHA